MNRWTLSCGMAVLCICGALVLGGTAPFGRLALALGLPGVAAPVLDDPAWKGVAHYRNGNFEAASRAFGATNAGLNKGNAEARLGNYAAALEAYDTARMRGDTLADANFDLVAAYYAGLALDPDTPIAWFTEKDGGEDPAVESFVARGSARAASTGDGSTNTGALLGLPELQSRGRLGVRKVFDDKFMVANRRWLTALEDVPGEYLAARIVMEYKRRKKLGLTPREPEDPE